MLKTISGVLSLFAISLSSFAGTLYDGQLPVTKSSPYKKMVHFNPLALMVGGFELGYEKATTAKESFMINFGYYLSEEAGALDVKDDFSNMSGIRLELQYRFYRKTNNYIKNVYLAPYANFKTMSADRTTSVTTYNPYTVKKETNRMSASTASIGYMLGIRKSVFENIYMDAAFGGGVFMPVSGENHKDLNIGLFSPYQKGVHFKASLGFLIAL